MNYTYNKIRPTTEIFSIFIKNFFDNFQISNNDTSSRAKHQWKNVSILSTHRAEGNKWWLVFSQSVQVAEDRPWTRPRWLRIYDVFIIRRVRWVLWFNDNFIFLGLRYRRFILHINFAVGNFYSTFAFSNQIDEDVENEGKDDTEKNRADDECHHFSWITISFNHKKLFSQHHTFPLWKFTLIRRANQKLDLMFKFPRERIQLKQWTLTDWFLRYDRVGFYKFPVPFPHSYIFSYAFCSHF